MKGHVFPPQPLTRRDEIYYNICRYVRNIRKGNHHGTDGNSFDMPIYYSDDKIKGRINGKNPIKIAFQNFAITDQSADTFFMGKPYFVRMNSSHPLVITVPMDTYNPDRHKNIAKVTLNINNDSDKPNYTVTLDGFVEK